MVASAMARGRNRGRAHRPPREPHSADQTTKECLALAEGEELELGLEEFGGLAFGFEAQGPKRSKAAL